MQKTVILGKIVDFWCGNQWKVTNFRAGLNQAVSAEDTGRHTVVCTGIWAWTENPYKPSVTG